MKRSTTIQLSSVLILALGLVSAGQAAEPVEPLLRDLPPSVIVQSSVEVPPVQARAIGQKLGGEVQWLTNSVVRVHGQPIQVNVLEAVDEVAAAALHSGLGKLKPYPFCVRKGVLVVEYVGRNINPTLARKTSYELGLEPKPSSMRYRVVAELATIEKADYMSCNPLFNQFLALRNGDNNAARQIEQLARKFEFGRSLTLRNPAIDGGSATHAFQPGALELKQIGPTVVHSFGDLPNRQGVPYVTATLEISVDDTGYRPQAAAPASELTAATAFWPADDPRAIALARQITAGKTTNLARAMAILRWLAPGDHLKYSGATGSRWGTIKVFEQKFGHCWDFSDCFVTLARASGVPSRQVAGWLYGASGHVWAEFYVEGKGWQQVDPTGGGQLRCGIYHIAYFTSADGEMPIVYLSMPQIEAIP